MRLNGYFGFNRPVNIWFLIGSRKAFSSTSSSRRSSNGCASGHDVEEEDEEELVFQEATCSTRANSADADGSGTPFTNAAAVSETPVTDFYSNATVLITGGTGFVGKVLTEKLLRSFGLRKIYMLIRSKDNMSVQERLQGFFNESVSVRTGCGSLSATHPIRTHPPARTMSDKKRTHPKKKTPNRYSIGCARRCRNCWRRCIRYALITVPSTWTLIPPTEQCSRLRSRWVSFVDVAPASPLLLPHHLFRSIGTTTPLLAIQSMVFLCEKLSWAFVVCAYLDGSPDACLFVSVYTQRTIILIFDMTYE